MPRVLPCSGLRRVHFPQNRSYGQGHSERRSERPILCEFSPSVRPVHSCDAAIPQRQAAPRTGAATGGRAGTQAPGQLRGQVLGLTSLLRGAAFEWPAIGLEGGLRRESCEWEALGRKGRFRREALGRKGGLRRADLERAALWQRRIREQAVRRALRHGPPPRRSTAGRAGSPRRRRRSHRSPLPSHRWHRATDGSPRLECAATNESPDSVARRRSSSACRRPTAQRPTAQRPTAQRPTAQRPTAQRPTAQRPTAQRPTAQRPTAE
jgi:hypothetical protein